MRPYRKLADKKAAAEYILANRETKTLEELSQDLGVCRERVRQLAVAIGATKPKKGLAWYRAEVKRLQQELAKREDMQHMSIA